MAISRRAATPKGGRPTRRMARSCAGDASGMSEKSIPRRRIRLPLFAARPPRVDDPETFAIVSPPDGIRHDEDAAGCRPAQSERSSLLPGVPQIRAIEGVRVAEHGRRLVERDSVLAAVDCGLPRVPLEHSSVYTKLAGARCRGVELARFRSSVTRPGFCCGALSSTTSRW